MSSWKTAKKAPMTIEMAPSHTSTRLRLERSRTSRAVVDLVDAQHADDPHLDHEAGEDGADGARRDRVRVRQPDVQREERRLDHEAEHERGERDRAGIGGAYAARRDAISAMFRLPVSA